MEQRAGYSPGAVDLVEPHRSNYVCDCSADNGGECICDAETYTGLPYECDHWCPVHDCYHCPFCFTVHHIHFASEAAGARHDCTGLWDNLYEHALAHVSPWQSYNFFNDLLLDGYDGGWDDAYRAWLEQWGPSGSGEFE